MKQMRHIVLLLSSPALAEALDEKNGLKHPKIGLRRETCISENLWSDVVMNADLFMSAYS